MKRWVETSGGQLTGSIPPIRASTLSEKHSIYLKAGCVDLYSKNCNGGIKVITCLAQWRMHTPPLPHPHSFCVCKASKMLRRPIHLLTLAGCSGLLQIKCDADMKFSARLFFKLHFQCSSNEALVVDSTSRCSFKSPLRP